MLTLAARCCVCAICECGVELHADEWQQQQTKNSWTSVIVVVVVGGQCLEVKVFADIIIVRLQARLNCKPVRCKPWPILYHTWITYMHICKCAQMCAVWFRLWSATFDAFSRWRQRKRKEKICTPLPLIPNFMCYAIQCEQIHFVIINAISSSCFFGIFS